MGRRLKRAEWKTGETTRKKGQGLRHRDGPTGTDALASTAERAKTFARHAPDAPRHGSWGR